MAKQYGRKFDRFYVALGLPIKEDGYEIDYDAFRASIRLFLEDDFLSIGGAFIVNPEAGQIFTLDRDEKRKVLSVALEEIRGKAPVFAGVLHTTTRGTALEAKDAAAEGADGIFTMPPIGGLDITHGWDVRAYPEVYYDLCKAIADAADLPFIVHASGPVSGVYGISYPPDVVDKFLEEVPNIVGWKLMYQYKALRDVCQFFKDREKRTGRHIGLLLASAHYYFEGMLSGLMDGTVSCFWNYAKEPTARLIALLQKDDIKAARELWLDQGLFQLHNTVGKSNARLHTAFHTATWLRGIYPTPYQRAPMPLPRKAEIVQLRDSLVEAGLSVIGDDKIQAVCNKLPR